jgi:hypothetical protein
MMRLSLAPSTLPPSPAPPAATAGGASEVAAAEGEVAVDSDVEDVAKAKLEARKNPLRSPRADALAVGLEVALEGAARLRSGRAWPRALIA